MNPEPILVNRMTVVEVENRYAGTGLGRKPLAGVCKTFKLIKNCTKRLATKGFEIVTEEKLKQAAEGYKINPADVLKMLLIAAYKPED